MSSIPAPAPMTLEDIQTLNMLQHLLDLDSPMPFTHPGTYQFPVRYPKPQRNPTRVRKKRVLYACARCRERKLKCDRSRPCSSCGMAGSDCRYEGGSSPSKPPNPHKTQTRRHIVDVPVELQFNAQVLGAKEMMFVKIYQCDMNVYLPILSDALLFEGLTTVGQLNKEKHAAKAAVWAAASIGAAFERDSSAVDMYEGAIEQLRQCYDFPCEEVFRAYFLVALCAFTLGDAKRFCQFITWAEVLIYEMRNVISRECQALMYHFCTILPGLSRFQYIPEICQKKIETAQVLILPIESQALYVIGYGCYKLDEIMRNSRLDTRQAQFSEVLDLIEALSARISETDSSNHVLASLYCNTLIAFCTANLGRAEESRNAVERYADLLSNRLECLKINQVWKTAGWLAGLMQSMDQGSLVARLHCLMSTTSPFPSLTMDKYQSDFVVGSVLLDDFKNMCRISKTR